MCRVLRLIVTGTNPRRPGMSQTLELAQSGNDCSRIVLLCCSLQVPKNMDADALRPLFAEFGQVFDLAIIRDKQTGMHRGCAFLTYCTRASAEAATLALHGTRKLVGSANALQVRQVHAPMVEPMIESRMMHPVARRFATMATLRNILSVAKSILY